LDLPALKTNASIRALNLGESCDPWDVEIFWDGLVTALTRVLLFHVDSSGIRNRSMLVLNPQNPCIRINPRIQLFGWIYIYTDIHIYYKHVIIYI
jgi:hypothetical protein